MIVKNEGLKLKFERAAAADNGRLFLGVSNIDGEQTQESISDHEDEELEPSQIVKNKINQITNRHKQ